jgi:hypothetical protein
MGFNIDQVHLPSIAAMGGVNDNLVAGGIGARV